MKRSRIASFSLRRFWRRQTLPSRGLPTKWVVLFCLVIVCVIKFVPYPYSPQYQLINNEQSVMWSRIAEVIQAKDIVSNVYERIRSMSDCFFFEIFQRDVLSTTYKIIQQGSVERSTATPMIILLYTKVFSQKKYCHMSIDRIFGPTCPSRDRCKWTCDNRRLAQADAIIFHAYDIEFHQAHVPNRSETKPNSIWILWSDEPPSIINYTLFQSYQFNWTMSYKLNSEVSIGTYGLFQQRELTWSVPDYNRWIQEQFNRRQNGALWFVSNCAAKERLKYYNDLRKESSTTVEGYGRCVDYYPAHWCSPGTQCELDYMSKYKFFLSFESTTCRDYITEKFYKALHHGLIPVVYGPDSDYYNNLAPPNSFIHINEHHANMTKLAKYLQAVHSNFELFSMYHQWRKKYMIVIDKKAVDRVRVCELCERLAKTREDAVTYYQDIDSFYREGC